MSNGAGRPPTPEELFSVLFGGAVRAREAAIAREKEREDVEMVRRRSWDLLVEAG